MKAQLSRSDRLALADEVIVNDADLTHLQVEVEHLHQTYLELVSEY